MVDIETARRLCLSLPEATEYDHFGKPAYRLKKKIFVTLWLDDKRAVLKLSPAQQTDFCERYSAVVFPVKGTWGKFGWTFIELDKIKEAVFLKALTAAWKNVGPKPHPKKKLKD